MASDNSDLATEVEKYGWYHTLDLGGGVVTKGMFDHRGNENRYLIPEDLSGMRCLDIGTMDGFWAFEMERRGAAEVVALDIEDPNALDWPIAQRVKTVMTMDIEKPIRFQLAHDAYNSKVKRVLRSVYEIDTDLGEFDLVFCGDLLVHIKDPATAVEKMRLVSRGSAIICNPIKKFRLFDNKPMAEFDGIDEFQWWVTNLEGLKRIVLAAGFSRVEAAKPFELPGTFGGPWKGLRGVVRGFV